jgi:hypothetical protein
MIRTMARSSYYAMWILIALGVIFVTAPIIAALLVGRAICASSCGPLAGPAICAGGWALQGLLFIPVIAVIYLLVAMWLGYWVYYRPAPMDKEAAYPETWSR